MGHWYAKDGTPTYEVPKASGGMKSATIADARKLDLCPSVTSVIGVMSKPGLERWIRRQIVLAAITTDRERNESDEEFVARILRDSGEEGRKAANLGTDIHDGLSDWLINDKPPVGDIYHIARPAKEWCDKYVKSIVSSERSFCNGLWGGRLDLECVLLNDGKCVDAIIDFKSQKTKNGKFAAY